MPEDIFDDQEGELAAVQQKLKDLENQLSGLNPRNLAGIQTKELQAATRANIFGDGSDGEVTITGTTTLTTDKFYSKLIVDNGATLNTGGYKVYCSSDLINNGTITRSGANGGNGTAGSGTTPGTGGAAGTALASGSLIGGLPGTIGGDGGANGNNGDNGSNGLDAEKSLGASGTGGAGGGIGGHDGTAGGSPGSGGNGGNGGSQTGTVVSPPRSPQAVNDLKDPDNVSRVTLSVDTTYYATVPRRVTIGTSSGTSSKVIASTTKTDVDSESAATLVYLDGSSGGTGHAHINAGEYYRITGSVDLGYEVVEPLHTGSAASGGSGGGGGGTNSGGSTGGAGGGAGGSGSTGGIVTIFASRLINNGAIAVDGGDGGTGGNGADGQDGGTDGSGGGGGGGGGAGGTGGVLFLVVGTKTGAGTATVAGGNGGAGGTGGSGGTGSSTTGETGDNGQDGTDGNAGTLVEIEIG